MKNVITTLALGTVALSMAACSSGASSVTASYVPSSIYEDHSCSALDRELVRVNNKARTLTGQLEQDASSDETVAVVGAILFWPALFFIDGDDPVKQNQLSDLLGRAEAIEDARILKGC